MKEIPKNFRYGYIRVSSKSQEMNSSLDWQKQQLIKYGILEKNIRIEISSDADSYEERSVFKKLIDEELQENYLLVVTKIDRCSRNALEFLKLQEKLFKKSVTFISLDLSYSNDMAVNKLIASNLAAIATFENERRRERQRQGIEAAKKAGGKYLGRKTVITPQLISQVKHFKEDKNLTVVQISKLTGKGRNTIYKVLKNQLGYVSPRLVKKEENENGKT